VGPAVQVEVAVGLAAGAGRGQGDHDDVDDGHVLSPADSRRGRSATPTRPLAANPATAQKAPSPSISRLLGLRAIGVPSRLMASRLATGHKDGVKKVGADAKKSSRTGSGAPGVLS
jgi:hypothetical protein